MNEPAATTPNTTRPRKALDANIEPRLLDLHPEDWARLARLRNNFSDTTYPDYDLDYLQRASLLRLVRAGLVSFDNSSCSYALHIDVGPYMQGRAAALGEHPQPADTNPYDRQRQRFEHHAWNNGHAQRAHTRKLA